MSPDVSHRSHKENRSLAHELHSSGEAPSVCIPQMYTFTSILSPLSLPSPLCPSHHPSLTLSVYLSRLSVSICRCLNNTRQRKSKHATYPQTMDKLIQDVPSILHKSATEQTLTKNQMYHQPPYIQSKPL